MNNKILFFVDVVWCNLFNSIYFFWIDVGYGYGEDLIWWKNFWLWKFFDYYDMIMYIEFNDFRWYIDINNLYKVNMGFVFCGGFFGGDGGVILRYEWLYRKMFWKFLIEYIVDDD